MSAKTNRDTSKRFRVVPQEQGMTLRNLVMRRVGELNRDSSAKLIRAGGVYVNRLRVRLPQVLVAAGERVTVYLEALEAKPLEPEQLRFVHRDPSFVVLDKPAGVPVAAVRETAVGSLSEALIHQLEREGITRPYVGLVHRLDRGASGLVLFTVRSVANKSIHKQFTEHTIKRGYRILARPREGLELAEHIECDAPIIKLREGVEIGGPKDGRSKPARSRFHKLAERAREAGGLDVLLDVEIETGRTHQIRAHAAHLGFPVVGDRRYGGEGASSGEQGEHERLHLHARSLSFTHPRTGEALSFESQLPEWAALSRALLDSR